MLGFLIWKMVFSTSPTFYGNSLAKFSGYRDD
jgi:hypothetical protein